MKTRMGINGFGRIGRLKLRALYPDGVKVMVVSHLADTKTNAHLFKWDSVYGPYAGEVSKCNPNTNATTVLGVNENMYDSQKHPTISNASFTAKNIIEDGVTEENWEGHQLPIWNSLHVSEIAVKKGGKT
jgi:glyceraldehyde 3-phosphate dehydrogenase